MGVLISLAAQLGDLSFSLIKREFGVKDYGHIFLAHGGVLDRFDSVIFAAPTLLVLLQLLRLYRIRAFQAIKIKRSRRI